MCKGTTGGSIVGPCSPTVPSQALIKIFINLHALCDLIWNDPRTFAILLGFRCDGDVAVHFIIRKRK